MQLVRSILSLMILAAALIVGLAAVVPQAGAAGAIVAFIAISALGAGMLPQTGRALVATLTVQEVLADVIASFRKHFPALSRMGTDFRADRLKLNQTYIAHIPTLPTLSVYGAGGYANGANAARGLLVDVPVLVDQHPTCPLKWLHLDQIKDNKNRYEEVIANAGYALGKGAIDNVLSGVNQRNFTHETTIAAADFDYDALQTITGLGNTQGMANLGRTLLVSTSVANYMAADNRLISKDFAGQLVTGEGYRRWVNVGGFAEIIEYPDMPTNNGANVTGVTAEADDDVVTKVAHGFQDGDRVTFVSGTGFTGLTAGTKYFVRDATADTFKLAATRGGAAIDITVDGSSGVFAITENLHAFAFDRRAIAMLAGVPDGFASPLAQSLGVPEVMGMDVVTESESGITMAAAKWQEPGTGDFYWVPTFVYGRSLGRQGVTNAADTLCDLAGLRIISS